MPTPIETVKAEEIVCCFLNFDHYLSFGIFVEGVVMFALHQLTGEMHQNRGQHC